MAYSKKTWKARQGLGLNKFSIDGATPVPVVNQPDSVTQQGDALSAGNLNDLEDRIANAFDDVENEKADKTEIENLQSQIDQHEARISNLEQVSGEYVTEDLQDYSTIQTGKASYVLVETLKGVSRVENQLVQNGNFVDSSGWYVTGGTIESVADNVITIKATDSTMYIGREGTFVVGHRYLWGATVKSSASLTAKFGDAYDIFGSFSLTANSWMQMLDSHSCNSASANRFRYYFYNCTVGDTVQIKQCFVRDLSLYFNGNIPSNAQTIAGIQQYYPELLEARDYNAGEIVDSSYTKVESVGVNLFDKTTATHNVSLTSDGTLQTASSGWVSDYIPVKALTDYYYTNVYSSSSRLTMAYYTSDKTFISTAGIYNDTLVASGTKTTPSNTAFVRISIPEAYIDSAMINKGTTGVSYHPYMTDQLAIPSVTLKGAGSVSDTLDVESGEITRRIGSVDLGSLTWFSYGAGTSGTYYAELPSGKEGLCAEFENAPINTEYILEDKTFCFRNVDNIVFFRDASQSSASDFKTSVTGVYLQYALATTTSDSVSPTLDNTIKTEGGGTVFTDAEVDGQFTLGFLNL